MSTLKDASSLKYNIKNRLSHLGVIQDGTPLGSLIDAITEEFHSELYSLRDELRRRDEEIVDDVKFTVQTVKQQVTILEANPRNTIEIAEELWKKIEKKKEAEKALFVEELEKL